MAGGGVQLVAGESEFGVGFFGDRIVAEHLERDFAATPFLGDGLNLLQHALAQSVAPKVLQYHHVMDVDEGMAGKAGETFQTIHQARGFAIDVG